jgi:hypothetical protein
MRLNLGGLIFIFGTGRCGTKTLSKVFEEVPGSICGHEGLFVHGSSKVKFSDLKEFNELIYYSKNNENLLDKTFLTGDDSIFLKMDNLFFSRKKFFNKHKGSSLILESNPYFYNFINYIYRLYPDSAFIHLIRDSESVVSSYLNRRVNPKKGVCIHRPYSSYPDSIPESSYYGYQAGKPRPFLSDKYFEEWRQLERIEKLSWFWNNVNLNIKKRMDLLPTKRKYLIRLEDINLYDFEKIFKESKIKYDKEYIKIQKLNKGNGKNFINEKNIKKHLEITKEARSIFGY